jgi:hypothetical protein
MLKSDWRFCLSVAALLGVVSWLCLPLMSAAAPRDFGGDNKSDLILTNASGQIDSLQMNGVGIASRTALLAANSGWRVIFIADFNGDGKADLLWQHTDGSSALWLMNGASLVSSASLLGPNSGWRVTHTADLNGDGKSDLLWQHNNGSVAAWLMNGTSLQSGVGLLGANTGWRVTHTADLNGDGKSDLLWQHNDGTTAVWLMNGAALQTGAGLLGANSGWRVTHTADLNGDGKSDLLWQHNDGATAVWLMNGVALQTGTGLLAANSGWRVTHTADLNGDGKSDLLWQHNDGTTVAWLMNGVNLQTGTTLLSGAAGWRVIDTADFNGDNKADLLWQHNDGTINAWLMNGVTLTAGATIQAAGTSRSLPPVKTIERCDPDANSICVLTPSPTSAIVHWQLGQSAGSLGIVDFHIYRNNIRRMVAEETSNRFRDIDLTPGSSNTYRVDALNASGTVVRSYTASVVQPSGSSDLTNADLPPTSAATSRAFTTFGWTPNPLYDTCTKTLHDAHWTYGPDNKVYPTWHPPIYEFANGTTCTFGHEHGQDQRQSNLYTTAGAIPFGYVNEQLSPNDPNFQRNEDHVGHKVALFNALPGLDRDTGAELECDVFFKLHQGTHSPDAFRNNAHERFLNYRCTNGFEVRWKSLHSFGVVNSFTQEVSNLIPRSEIATSGAVPATQPYGGDRRLIPTQYTISVTGAQGTSTDEVSSSASGITNCDNCKGSNGLPAYISRWNRETWQGGPGIRLVSDSTPNAVTAFGFGGGPYWNLANSSRFYDPSGSSDPNNLQSYQLGRQLSLCFTVGAPAYQSMDCQLARARSGGAAFNWDDPRSPIKGTMRFNEFNFVGLYNPDPRNSRLFSDVYGNFQAGNNDVNNASRSRTSALPIRQYFGVTTRELNLKAANWAGTAHCGGRTGAGSCWTDFGQFVLKNGQQVDARIHAPN